MKKLLYHIAILVAVSVSFAACEDEPTPMPEPGPMPDTTATPIDTVVDTVVPYSGTLPVMYIVTDSNCAITSKEEYVHANWWLDAKGTTGKGYESLGSAREPLSMLIKGRGNSTWTMQDKKPYRLKFDEKHNILGLPSNRHFVLMANATYWMGQMNDAVPFEISRRMGMYAPRMRPVEVVLNGDYIGLYFLVEKVRVGKNRVNIVEQNDLETDSLLITGGWLIEIENYGNEAIFKFDEGNGEPFWVTSHTPEALSQQQYDYMYNFLREADSLIYLPDKTSREWENYIDIDSLAVYYIVQEVVDNSEAFSGSCYMHKQRGNGTKLIFGPLWDCGSSFARWSQNYAFNEFIYENLPDYCRCRWIGEIVKFPHFMERVRYHWKRFYNKVYPAMDAYMNMLGASIEQAGNCDHKRWPQNPFDDICHRINTFYKPSFHKKVEWLNNQWGR